MDESLLLVGSLEGRIQGYRGGGNKFVLVIIVLYIYNYKLNQNYFSFPILERFF